MSRGAVGDLLVRDDCSGAVYQKLSGVNDTCFVRSTLNVVTSEEVEITNSSYDIHKKRIKESLHDIQYEDGAFNVNDEDGRQESQSSFHRITEVIDGDTHWRRTTQDLVYERRIESRNTNQISPRIPESQKRTAREAFPLSANLDQCDTPGFRKSQGDHFTTDHIDIVPPCLVSLPTSGIVVCL